MVGLPSDSSAITESCVMASGGCAFAEFSMKRAANSATPTPATLAWRSSKRNTFREISTLMVIVGSMHVAKACVKGVPGRFKGRSSEEAAVLTLAIAGKPVLGRPRRPFLAHRPRFPEDCKISGASRVIPLE